MGSTLSSLRPREGRREGGKNGRREGKKEGEREERKTLSDMMSSPNFYNENMGLESFHCDKQACFAVVTLQLTICTTGMSVHCNQTVDMTAASTFHSRHIFFHVSYWLDIR